MPTILICGYYGAGNLGDEAILSAMLADLRSQRDDLDFIILSFDPAETAQRYGVQSIFYKDLAGLAAAAQTCDLFILGGGGLFHDYWGVSEDDLFTQAHLGISYYCTAVLLARLYKKPVMLYAVGVGPLFHESGEQLTRLCFENADIATLRDLESLELLESLGISSQEMHVLADPAFSLQPDYATANLILQDVLSEEKPVVGICLRNWDVGVSAQAWQAEVAQALDQFLDATPAQLLFIPFQVSSADILVNDQKVAENVLAMMDHAEHGIIVEGDHTPETVMAMLSRCDLVLGMRLHSVILAASSAIPMAGIIYDPKVRNVMHHLDMDAYGIDIKQLDATALANALNDAWQKRETLRKTLQSKSDDLKDKAQNSSALAIRTMQEIHHHESLSPELEAYLNQLLVRQSLVRVNLEDELAATKNQVRELQSEVAEKDQSIHQLNWEKQQLMGDKEALTYTLNEIYISKAWALMMRLRKLRYWLFPAGSKREKVIKAIWKFFKNFRQIFAYSWQAYYFQRYKRARNRNFCAHFAGLNTPHKPEKVSVVLPVYNGEDYIHEAVDSILAQTYPNFELIIVDDGSTDATPEIVDAYAHSDARVHVIHQVNQRLPAALNTGFRHATGEYLTWTSSDNRLKPEFLANMVDDLKAHPKWDCEYGNIIIIDDDGQVMLDSDWYKGYQKPGGSGKVHMPTDPSELNVVANNYVGAAFLYRRHVHALLGDYSPFRFGTEDYDYWMRINALLNLNHTAFKEPLYEYRFHSTSLTSRDNELGITRSREGLMVFEDARRDFYNMPTAWMLKTDAHPLSARIADSLRRQIAKADHLMIEAQDFDQKRLPKLWAPLVGLLLTTMPHAAKPDPAWPEHALKVLVHLGEGTLPDEVDPDWDMCFGLTDQEVLPELAKLRQGWFGSRDAATLFTAIDVREKSRQMANLEEEIFIRPDSKFKASVIICTYHRGPKLVDSIRSVAEQRFPQSDYELIIVNNDPKDGSVAEAVTTIRQAYFRDHPDHLRLILCPYPGLSNARNAGISEAQGEVLCFIDDDALAQEDWLENIWGAFEGHPKTGVVGGTILLDVPSPRPEWLQTDWESYWSRFTVEYESYREIETWYEFPYGANWCARRAALIESGGFRSRFGRRGSDFGGGEEILAALLIQRMGYQIAVEPRAVVMHKVEPSRFSLEHVQKTILAAERTWYRLQTDLYIPNELSLRNIFRRFKGKLGMRKTWGKLKTRYSLLAEWHILSWFIKDQFNRMRKIFSWRW
jgi:polysaccharide pyruvyl transferase CsaB